MPRKDPFKGPGTVKFQLVHRSQRDPLIHSSEASQNIFKPIGKDGQFSSEGLQGAGRPKSPSDVGDASKYGVYFDDSQYDYMQHLRPVGEKDDNVESILLEVPGKRKPLPGLIFKEEAIRDVADIPDEFLPPKTELPGGYETQRNIPSAISGFRPDMNPHLRQTLEALEDEEFVDDGLEDDFFQELVQDGEVSGEHEVDFPFDEQGVPEVQECASLGDDAEEPHDDEDPSWEARFEQFKKARQRTQATDGASERDNLASEGGDTVGTLPQMSVLGIRKRRKKNGSEASGYTMSSSSMFRNAGLTLLDERFEQTLEEYENAHDIDCGCSDCDERPQRTNGADEDDDDDSIAGDLINSRDDLEDILDEFLNKYEIIGRQLKPVMEGETWTEKLNTMRHGIPGTNVEDEALTKQLIKRLVKMQLDAKKAEEEDAIVVEDNDADDAKERWDCETILSTYSNMENHPRIIRACDTRKVPKIRLDPKTGLPVVADENGAKRPVREKAPPVSRTIGADRSALIDQVLGALRNGQVTQPVLARSRGESKEAKAARKHAVKEQRQARRTEKKVMKESFTKEKQLQVKTQLGRQQGGVGLKKL